MQLPLKRGVSMMQRKEGVLLMLLIRIGSLEKE